MRKEAKLLLGKAVESLILSTEVFNRPTNTGRVHAFLILLDHAFEMQLKAAIIHRGGKIRKPRENQTIGFDECVRKSLSDGAVQFLSDEQALLLQSINSLRDAAQHHLVDVSEPLLYIQAQAGLTLFGDILKKVFGQSLYEVLPERVLPISTSPPRDLHAVFREEVKAVRNLLAPGRRKRTEAKSRIKSMAIMESANSGIRSQPAESNLETYADAIAEGQPWQKIFPGVSTINISSNRKGPAIELRIVKKEGIPVELVPEGTPDAAVVAVRRVNELDYYSMGCNQLAVKVGLNPHQTQAAIWYLRLKDDADYFREIVIGKSRHKRYSAKCIGKIKQTVSEFSIDEICRAYQKRTINRRKT